MLEHISHSPVSPFTAGALRIINMRAIKCRISLITLCLRRQRLAATLKPLITSSAQCSAGGTTRLWCSCGSSQYHFDKFLSSLMWFLVLRRQCIWDVEFDLQEWWGCRSVSHLNPRSQSFSAEESLCSLLILWLLHSQDIKLRVQQLQNKYRKKGVSVSDGVV